VVEGAEVCGSCFARLPSDLLVAAAEEQARLRRIVATTAPTFEPTHRIVEWRGPVFGEAVLGGSAFAELTSATRAVSGGRASAFEKHLQHARDIALDAMREQCRDAGGDGIVAVHLAYETIKGTTLMVTAQGPAVLLDPSPVGRVDAAPNPLGTRW
jgi:uncharacterized protein YbjQ (UPF0145 family)